MFGPVFLREASVAPKQTRFYLSRSIYLLALFLLMCTGYLVLSGMRPLRSAGDLARYGGWMFLLLAPLQMLVLSFQAAVGSASSVAQEKDRRTLILMLLTRLTGSELVVGKLAAGLLSVLTMLAAALPLFLILPLFGGVSPSQVGKVYAVTLATLLLSSTMGTVVALWREKTFQSIAFTVLALVLWDAVWECVATGLVPGIAVGWADFFSPARALLYAASPLGTSSTAAVDPTLGFSVITVILSLLIISVGIARIRVWNPSREARLTPPSPESSEEEAKRTADSSSDTAISDGSVQTSGWKVREPRSVWANPILWREVCTWAYGRKILLIRLTYLLLCLLAVFALWSTIQSGEAFARTGVGGRTLPAATLPVAAIGVVSLLMVNALAVNSVTTERDLLAFDLLLVTDLRPSEFVFGKIFGVLYVAKEMLLLPGATLAILGGLGVMTVENTIYAVIGLGSLFLFVASLGIHCGLSYPAGRTATLVSLGTVFFLCVGVAICMIIMVSFRGAFQLQLAPFLTMILGGGAGLYAALGWRNPSSAIFTASFLLPLVTFYAITQFLLQRDQLFVFATVVGGYGFATAAMLVPALSELDVSLERHRGEGTDE